MGQARKNASIEMNLIQMNRPNEMAEKTASTIEAVIHIKATPGIDTSTEMQFFFLHRIKGNGRKTIGIGSK